jgi:hypothetical protein
MHSPLQTLTGLRCIRKNKVVAKGSRKGLHLTSGDVRFRLGLEPGLRAEHFRTDVRSNNRVLRDLAVGALQAHEIESKRSAYTSDK